MESEINQALIAKDSADAKLQRGPESYNFFYVALGFAISIEGSIVQMIGSIQFPYNIILFAVMAFASYRLCLFNGWFQNKLIGWKIAYENKPR